MINFKKHICANKIVFSLNANGSTTELATVLTLTFDKVITGLAAEDIALTAGETGATGTVPAAYDPCTHYLGSDWRLPTTDEYKALFNNVTDSKWGNSGGWSWDPSSKSATHANGSKFPASGYRSGHDGSLNGVGTSGSYWSASPSVGNNGYSLDFR